MRDLVIYPHIDGRSAREALAHQVDRVQVFNGYADLLARLHEHGVYCRAAHLGNVLIVEGLGDLVLIDFADTLFRPQSPTPRLRARNFRPLTRYSEDLAALQSFGPDRFVHRYLDLAKLAKHDIARFVKALWRVHPVFAGLPLR